MRGCTPHQQAWFVSCTAIHVGSHPLFEAMLSYDFRGYMKNTVCCAFLEALILLSPTRALPIVLRFVAICSNNVCNTMLDGGQGLREEGEGVLPIPCKRRWKEEGGNTRTRCFSRQVCACVCRTGCDSGNTVLEQKQKN